MTVVFIKDFVKARSGVKRDHLVPLPAPSTERKAQVKTEPSGAWYHRAAIVEAEKEVPRRD